MNRRFGLYVGLGCCLPVCVWAAGTIRAANGLNAGETLATAVESIWILQAMAIAVFPSRIRSVTDCKAGLENTALMILVPLPILAIAWLAGGVSGLFVARLAAGLVFFAMLAAGLTGICGRYLPVTWGEPALGLVLAALVWRHGDHWLAWLQP